jgi:hypothetical protein
MVERGGGDNLTAIAFCLENVEASTSQHLYWPPRLVTRIALPFLYLVWVALKFWKYFWNKCRTRSHGSIVSVWLDGWSRPDRLLCPPVWSVVGTGLSFSEAKRPGCWTDHSPATSSEVKKAVSHASLHPPPPRGGWGWGGLGDMWGGGF